MVRLRSPAPYFMGEFPSGQRGQTVNLLSLTSLVRIQLPPPIKKHRLYVGVFLLLRIACDPEQALACKCAGSHLSGSRRKLACVRLSEKSSPSANTQLLRQPLWLVFFYAEEADASNSVTKSSLCRIPRSGILPGENHCLAIRIAPRNCLK